MAKTFERVSLATKFRVLFAAAVLAILAAALGVPWYFTERLVDEAAEQSAADVGRLFLQEWMDQHVPGPDGRRRPSAIADYFTHGPDAEGRRGPKFVALPHRPADGPWDEPLQQAVRTFEAHPGRTAALRLAAGAADEPVYRYFRAVRADATCRRCHDGSVAKQAFQLNQLVGVIDITTPPTPQALVWWTRGVFVLGGALAALLAFVVFYVITRQIILSPVRKLRDLADKVAEGDMTRRSDVRTGDEFEQLSRRFNEMLDGINAQQEQLRQANRALDLRLNEMAEANVALYEANRIKNEFLANVSHELRTPLNSIIGFAELLSQTDDEKRRRHANNILSSAKLLLGIINDLLDLARIEAGKAEVRWEKVSISDLCETLGQLIRPLADQNHLHLGVLVDPLLPVVRTDPGKLQQVLYNLLSNAVKFTPPEGRVTLSARLVPAAESPLQADSVAVAVADTGPGIPEADQSRIFEKFHRLDNPMTRRHGGAGLGLSISRELTNLLGGRLSLDSEPGQGTTFTVLLPVAGKEPPANGPDARR